MRENKRVYGAAALAAACALALTAFAAGTATPGQSQNKNDNGSNANANGSAGGNTNANTRNVNGNAGGQTGTAGGGQTGAAGQGGTLGSTDRQFLTKAAMMDMAEIETGRLAISQGASDAVKQFGQRMIDDHTRTSQQLTQIASAAGFTPPPTLDARHQAAAAKLARLTGDEFDRAYMKQMVKDLQEAVSLYQRQSTRGTMPDLRAFAADTLPALQEHLSMARSMTAGGSAHGSMNRGTNSNANTTGNTGTGGNANTNANSNGSTPPSR